MSKITGEVIKLIKKPYFYTLLATLAIIFSCVCVTYNQFSIKETYSIDSQIQGETPSLRPEMILHQEINVSGIINNFNINLCDIDNQYIEGGIDIMIKNRDGESFSRNIVPLSDNPIISMELPTGIKGPLDVYIRGGDGEPIKLKTMSETLLGKYDINGVTQAGNLLITFDCSIVPSYTYLRIALIVLMVGCFIFLFWIRKMPEIQRARSMYWVALVLICSTICIRYPGYTIFAEPYLETGTNFFHQTYLRGIRSLLLDDAGYLPLIQRILAMLIVLIFKQTKWAILIFSLICLCSVCLLSAEIVKSRYKKYFFLEARFIFALFMGATCFFPTVQMLYLHNLGYLSFLFIVYVFLSDIEEFSNKKMLLVSIITILLTISKVYYVGLIPLVFLTILFKRKQLGRKTQIYSVMCCIGPVLQAGYLMSGIAEDAWISKHKDIVTCVAEAMYNYLQMFFYFIKDFEKKADVGGLFLNLFVLAILFVVFLRLVIYHKRNRSIFCIALFAWGLGIAFINAYYNRVAQSIDKSFVFRVTSYTGGRIDYLAYVGILFFVFCLISDGFFIEYNAIWKKTLLCLVLFLGVCRFSSELTNAVGTDRQTNWLRFSEIMNQSAYAIPIGDRDGFITKNSEVYFYGNRDINKAVVRQSIKVTEKDPVQSNTLSQLNFGDSLDTEKVISVYTNKVYISQSKDIVIQLFDDQDRLLTQKKGIAEFDKRVIGFQFDEPIGTVSKVRFVDQMSGAPYEVRAEVFVGVTK